MQIILTEEEYAKLKEPPADMIPKSQYREAVEEFRKTVEPMIRDETFNAAAHGLGRLSPSTQRFLNAFRNLILQLKV